MTQWRNNKTEDLFEALLLLKDTDEAARFLRDLLTEGEIEEFAARWQVAQELESGKTQRTVSRETGVSIATVTRVNQWLKRGMGGYMTIINRINDKSVSIGRSQYQHHSVRNSLVDTS